MAGLPKKYIKKYGVTKKAWAAYRKDKNSRKTAGGAKMATKRKRRAPARRRSTTRATTRAAARRTYTPRRRYTRRRASTAIMGRARRRRVSGFSINKVADVARIGLTGAAGAVLTGAGVRALPVTTAQSKAWTQFALGAALYMFAPKRRKFGKVVKIAGIGATIASATSLVKMFMPEIPMLSGLDNPYYTGGGMKGIVDRSAVREIADNSSKSSSMNATFDSLKNVNMGAGYDSFSPASAYMSSHGW